MEITKRSVIKFKLIKVNGIVNICHYHSHFIIVWSKFLRDNMNNHNDNGNDNMNTNYDNTHNTDQNNENNDDYNNKYNDYNDKDINRRVNE